MEWKPIEPEEHVPASLVKFQEAGEEFMGIFKGVIEFSNEHGDGIMYKFLDIESDEEYIIFGGLKVLDDRMRRVPIDSPVKIVYLGKKQSSKNKSRFFKDFSVFIGQ